jgi:hypothetical protein
MREEKQAVMPPIKHLTNFLDFFLQKWPAIANPLK